MSQTTLAKPNVALLDGVTKKTRSSSRPLGPHRQGQHAGDPGLWPKLMRHVPLPGRRARSAYGLCYGANMQMAASTTWPPSRWSPAPSRPADLTLMQVPAQNLHGLPITGAGEITRR